MTFDNQGNIISVDIVGPPDMIISARITEWFGFEDNNQNAVGTGTINLQGTTLDGGATVPAGQSVSYHNLNQVHWAVGADTEGPPTSFTNKVNCGPRTRLRSSLYPITPALLAYTAGFPRSLQACQR